MAKAYLKRLEEENAKLRKENVKLQNYERQNEVLKLFLHNSLLNLRQFVFETQAADKFQTYIESYEGRINKLEPIKRYLNTVDLEFFASSNKIKELIKAIENV